MQIDVALVEATRRFSGEVAQALLVRGCEDAGRYPWTDVLYLNFSLMNSKFCNQKVKRSKRVVLVSYGLLASKCHIAEAAVS
jgi:hypothetical protein